jgi:hypothetical protein
LAVPQANLDNSFLKTKSKNKSIKFISDDDDEDAVVAKKPKLSTQITVAAKSKIVNTKSIANVKKKENRSSDSSSSDISSDSDTQDNKTKPAVKTPSVKQVVKTTSVNPVKKTLAVKPEQISSSESDSSSDSMPSYTKQKKIVKKTNNLLKGKSAANSAVVKKEPTLVPEKHVTPGRNSSKDVSTGILVKRKIATIAPLLLAKNPSNKENNIDPNYNKYDHWENKEKYSTSNFDYSTLNY